jgi:hypothetical protein
LDLLLTDLVDFDEPDDLGELEDFLVGMVVVEANVDPARSSESAEIVSHRRIRRLKRKRNTSEENL